MFTVHLDVVITRRKRFHMITDPAESVVYSSRLMGEIIEWLHNEGQSVYRLVSTDTGTQALVRVERSTQEL